MNTETLCKTSEGGQDIIHIKSEANGVCPLELWSLESVMCNPEALNV